MKGEEVELFSKTNLIKLLPLIGNIARTATLVALTELYIY